MVHAPAFFTFAAQLVFRLWSRSVAVIVRRPASPSPTAASKRKFDRIGIVVLRSTTLCAAVSSRSSSARETVISRLPVGVAAVVMSGSSIAVVTVGLSKKTFAGGAWHGAWGRWQDFTPNHGKDARTPVPASP